MKATIYFRDNYKNTKNEGAISLRIFLNNSYLNIPLNIYCQAENFDKKLNKILAGPDKNNHNHIIKDALGKASRIILKYKVNDRQLTREVFEKEFLNPAILTDFYAFMDDQIRMRIGDDLTESSAAQHFSTIEKFKLFRPSLLIVEIDEQMIRGFKKFLKEKLHNGPNTIYNTLKNVRTYINRAIKQELISVSPFRYYKLTKVEPEPEFLTEFELNSLFELYGSNYLPTKYQNVLRWYLFSCSTGLRISDLRAVRHEMVDNNILSFEPKKTLNTTKVVVHMPLTKVAKKLIKDENPLRVKGLLFDCISEPRMNLYIKEVVKETTPKIIKDISFHSARHTFATLFLKRIKQANGILILQKLLGHAKLESTMIYTHVLNDDVKDAMREFER